MSGWIKLHRKTKKWEWSDDPNVMCLWVHLLLRASFIDTSYRGFNIPCGSVVYGHSAFSEHSGLTVMQVRTALKKLQKSKNVTIKRTNKFSIISITKWSDYQDDNSPITGQQQASNRRVTALEEGKEGKKVKKSITLNKFEEFWINFPRQRRGSKQKAKSAYSRAIKRDSEENILNGLLSYAKSDEVRDGYAKGSEAWLNDDRWTNDYAMTPKNGKGRELSDEEFRRNDPDGLSEYSRRAVESFNHWDEDDDQGTQNATGTFDRTII